MQDQSIPDWQAEMLRQMLDPELSSNGSGSPSTPSWLDAPGGQSFGLQDGGYDFLPQDDRIDVVQAEFESTYSGYGELGPYYQLSPTWRGNDTIEQGFWPDATAGTCSQGVRNGTSTERTSKRIISSIDSSGMNPLQVCIVPQAIPTGMPQLRDSTSAHYHRSLRSNRCSNADTDTDFSGPSRDASYTPDSSPRGVRIECNRTSKRRRASQLKRDCQKCTCPEGCMDRKKGFPPEPLSFTRLSDLDRHWRLKHDPDANRYECPFHGCPVRSTRGDKVKEHWSKVHNKKNDPKLKFELRKIDRGARGVLVQQHKQLVSSFGQP